PAGPGARGGDLRRALVDRLAHRGDAALVAADARPRADNRRGHHVHAAEGSRRQPRVASAGALHAGRLRWSARRPPRPLWPLAGLIASVWRSSATRYPCTPWNGRGRRSARVSAASGSSRTITILAPSLWPGRCPRRRIVSPSGPA